MNTKVHWFDLSYVTKSALLVPLLEAGLGVYVENFAERVESYMQANAPWEDQTGAAREGLSADGSSEGSKYVVTLYHTVEYGIWLEVRWSGRYAIIVPTLEHFAPSFMTGLDMGGLTGGGGGGE